MNKKSHYLHHILFPVQVTGLFLLHQHSVDIPQSYDTTFFVCGFNSFWSGVHPNLPYMSAFLFQQLHIPIISCSCVSYLLLFCVSFSSEKFHLCSESLFLYLCECRRFILFSPIGGYKNHINKFVSLALFLNVCGSTLYISLILINFADMFSLILIQVYVYVTSQPRHRR